MADQERPAAGVGILARLDAEWVTVCADPQIGAAVRDWMADAQIPVFGPEEVLAALRPQPDQDNSMADAVLRTLLVRAAGTGRPATWAARIVVQTMLPAAVRIARGEPGPPVADPLRTVAHAPSASSSRWHGPAAPHPAWPARRECGRRHPQAHLPGAGPRMGGDAAYLDAATAEEQPAPNSAPRPHPA
ncbi:putative protein OS=Streptomyces antimycoticus OX=68175 GN=SANT12839_101440 PE=4 SV=1 [Streptomyces antimycoticus]